MEAEHCKKYGHDHHFETPNYKITTCPATEWNLVVRREGRTLEEFMEILSKEFQTVGLGPAHHGRRIPDVNELLKLEESRHANLIKCEVLAVVEYTGPLVRSTTRIFFSFADMLQQDAEPFSTVRST